MEKRSRRKLFRFDFEIKIVLNIFSILIKIKTS